MLIHFFIESGMIAAFIALLPMVLWSFFPDERLVTQVSGAIAIILAWFLWLPILAAVVSGQLWEPTLAVLEATSFLGLVGGGDVFITVLKTVLDARQDS